jgi:predicted DNA-binding transcriptional regulator YafY
MHSVEVSGDKFKYPRDFDPKEFYKDCYGIIKQSDVTAKRTIIKATAFQSHYLRNLPIHESQQEIESGEEYSLFELMICPTFDLCQHLLSLGDAVEVLEPKELREMMREQVEKMGQKYVLTYLKSSE